MSGHPFIASVRMPGYFASQADVDRFQAIFGGPATDRRPRLAQGAAPAMPNSPPPAKPDAGASMLASMRREIARANLAPAHGTETR